MLVINTMRYGTDNFIMRHRAAIFDKTGLDATKSTNVEGFSISGVQPNDCNRKAIFKVDDAWYKLAVSDGTATMEKTATQTPTIDSILEEGTAAATLATITNIPGFVGKKVFPALALDAPPDAEVLPTFGMALKKRSNQDQYQKEEISAEYPLTKDAEIVSITAETETTGRGEVNVTVALKQGESWTEFMPLLDAKGKKASALKYKATYTVKQLADGDSAKVNKVSAIYCTGTAAVSGDTAEILTITQNYENGLSFAQCVVKHKKLMDAKIKAFVAFRDKPKKRELINVGTGNGEIQTIKLGMQDSEGNITPDTGINHNTLRVQYDGKPSFEYSYNTETSELTFAAATGVAVTASYEYSWESETWQEMTAQEPQVYNDSGEQATKFVFALPQNAHDKTISDIKIQLYRPAGRVENESIGMATGERQLFVLEHYAKKETISCNASWSYDDLSRILSVVAPKGTEMSVSYDWIAETHEVSGLTAGWAE